jgi:malate synthase
MGITEHFRTTADWNQAIELLDHSFPLANGSHRTATAYLSFFDHLLVIQSDGTTTGLATPSQFVEASGLEDAPCCIHLEHNGLQVEIEPGRQCAVSGQNVPAHRMQLLTQINIT